MAQSKLCGLGPLGNKVKYLSSFTEAEIVAALASCPDISDHFKNDIHVLTSHISTTKKLKRASTKPKASRMKFATKSDRLKAMISKIRKQLADYESKGIKEDNWRINFKIGMDYSKKNLDDIIILHNRLMKSEANCNKIKLLAHYERGNLYSYLKNMKSSESWESRCQNLGVCRMSVCRYIAFAKVIQMYPRLLICDLTFEAIVSFKKELTAFMETDSVLKERLEQPLKSIRILSDITLGEDSLAAAFEDRANLDSDDSDDIDYLDWSPLYNVTDELLDELLEESSEDSQ